MGSLIVVHGTGVRADQYGKTFELVRRKLDRASRAHITPVECQWGTPYGVNLPERPLSLPGDTDRSLATQANDVDFADWSLLYADPFAELKQLSTQRGSGDWDVAELLTIFRSVPLPTALAESLAELGLESTWEESRREVTHNVILTGAAAPTPESTLFLRRTLSRAIVARMIQRAMNESAPVPDGEMRDKWVEQLMLAFCPPEDVSGSAASSPGGKAWPRPPRPVRAPHWPCRET